MPDTEIPTPAGRDVADDAPAAGPARSVAVIGSGIAGLAAAWLLARRHRVVLFEQGAWAGGHSNTRFVPGPDGQVPVDTGFIVYNQVTYPNLTALFDHLGVETHATDMSFAASLAGGRREYGSSGFDAVFGQRRNLASPRFWKMLVQIRRFFRNVPDVLAQAEDPELTLRQYLDRNGYGPALRDDHILPMVAAIWSTPMADAGDYPLAAFVRFFQNHGLLLLSGRPQWRTVTGGSRRYVQALLDQLGPAVVRLGTAVVAVDRTRPGPEVVTADGSRQAFDDVVIAIHSDQALTLLTAPTAQEKAYLGAIRYLENTAWLHSDTTLMPRRRRVWSSWNYMDLGAGTARLPCISYWMNRLQGLVTEQPVFVTLNPPHDPDPELVHYRATYHHPQYDPPAERARRRLWDLQGVGGVWFCGAYFGAGFHEDGLQAGLAVAEAVGGVRRPWSVPQESGRIHLPAGSGAIARAPRPQGVAA